MVKFATYLLLALMTVMVVAAEAQTPPTGKNPVIVIPGLSGSELVNRKTEELVWFKAQRSKDDDVRLPITGNPAEARDNLVARDIIRSVQIVKFLPEIEIYERLIDALSRRGGYREARFADAKKEDFQDTFFVFPYDWRRDNIENARLLVREIEKVKKQLGKPNLKFDVVAHSMGGLIARYAAMYGDADPPDSKKKVTWQGARHFDKIFLVGTPSSGSMLTLQSMLDGASIFGGVNIPFVRDINRFDLFSMPSVFQLLPHDGTARIFDENLKPLTVDLFSVRTWEDFGWAIWQDDEFKKRLTPDEQLDARRYFTNVLERARRFHAALDAANGGKFPVSIHLIGAECKETQDGVIVVRDPKRPRARTIFKPTSFETPDGRKLTASELKPLLVASGDGVVTSRSLRGGPNGEQSSMKVVSELFQCETHNRLVTNEDIQNRLLAILFGTKANAAVR